MATYSYRAVDAHGKKRSGVVEADSARAARQSLRGQNWLPLEIELSGQHESKQWLWLQPSLSIAELSLVTRQLSTLVASGMPLDNCLSAVAEQSEQQKTTKMIMAIRSRILEGYSLAYALGTFPRTFNNLFVATVEAGEQSGHLDTVLERLADYVESQDRLRKSIQLAAVYPTILVVIALGVVSYLLHSVVPKILDVFIVTNQRLPTPTQWLLNVTEFLSQNAGSLLLGLVGLILLHFWWHSSASRTYLRDRVLLRLPLFGKLIRGFNTARFASTLSTLGASGVPLVDAMGIAGHVVVNLPIKQSIEKATQQVREGSTLAAALKETGYFPPMMLHMVSSGEASGELDDMLDRTATNQQKDLEDLIRVIVALIEPLMLVLMGGIILIIVMAVVLPITQMTTGVQ